MFAPGLVAALLSATVLTAVGCGQDAPHGPRSVLLISIDSLRADRLGAYGNPRATSPTLDRLAAEGALFERVISPTSWTLPSHVTLLSALLPQQHGVMGREDRIGDRTPLLQEAFGRAGYETSGFFSGPFLHPYFGFGRGFDHYVSCESRPVEHPNLLEEHVRSHDDRTNAAVEHAFGAWVAGRARTKPFFAFVHMWDVHFDYIAPEPWGSMFDPDYQGALDGRHIADVGFPEHSPPRDVQHLLALYDGELRYTDETVAHMLKALDDAGLLDDTLVVVTSDHGEEFQEHGGKTHHRTVNIESVHVPLILWARHGLPHGLRVAPFVSLADVAPTVLDVVGLPPLGDDLTGRSLRPALDGQPLAPRPVYSAMAVPGEEWRRMLAIREGDRTSLFWKKTGAWIGYDAAHDPEERRPRALAAAELEPLARYDTSIMAVLDSRTAPANPVPADIDRRLRELGYIR